MNSLKFLQLKMGKNSYYYGSTIILVKKLEIV